MSILNELEDCNHGTALHSAIRWRRWDFALRLLKVPGIAVDVQDRYGRTPLTYIVREMRRDEFNNEEIAMVVQELLERNADLPLIRDKSRGTPWHSARRGGRAMLLQVFQRAYWNKVLVQEGRLALHTILRNTKFQGKRKGLRLYMNIGRLPMIDVHNVIIRGITEDPSLLRVRNSSGRLPLHVAAERGAPVHVFQLLGFPGALRVVDNAGGLAIHAACRTPVRGPTLKAIRYLVETGGPETARKRDRDGCLPLHLLLRDVKFSPPLEVVQCLVEANPASLSCRTMDGDLPITLAGKSPHLDVIYFMIRQFPGVVNAAIRD